MDSLEQRLRALHPTNWRTLPVAAVISGIVVAACIGIGTYFALGGGGSAGDGSVTTVTADADTAGSSAARSPKTVAAARIARAKEEKAVAARERAAAAKAAVEEAEDAERAEDIEQARDEAVEAARAARSAADEAEEAKDLAAALVARERATSERAGEERAGEEITGEGARAGDRASRGRRDADTGDRASQAEGRRSAADKASRHKRQVAGWALPIDAYELTGRFGQDGNKWASSHHGLDFAAPSGTPIRAVGKGTIIAAGWDGAYGNRILVEHADGTVTLYGHMSRFARTSGPIKAGTVIGYVGATGNVTGPHLHLEVRPDGGGLEDTIDPFEWLEDKGLTP